MSFIINYIYKSLFSNEVYLWPSPYIGLSKFDGRCLWICDTQDHYVVYNTVTKKIIYQNPSDEWKVDKYQEIYNIAIDNYMLKPEFFTDVKNGI
jgi:hypothetical protein